MKASLVFLSSKSLEEQICIGKIFDEIEIFPSLLDIWECGKNVMGWENDLKNNFF